MRKYGILGLALAAALGMGSQGRAATQITLTQTAIGSSLWDLAIKATPAADLSAGGSFGIANVMSATPDATTCNPASVLCAQDDILSFDPGNTLGLAPSWAFQFAIVSGNPLGDGASHRLEGVQIMAGLLPHFITSAAFTDNIGGLFAGSDASTHTTIPAVPEPATAVLLALGLGVMALPRRRQA